MGGYALDIGTIAGLAVGALALLASIGVGGAGLRGFMDPMSAALVLGGALAATCVNFPLTQIRQAIRSTARVLREPAHSPLQLRDLLLSLSQKARREGILSLETDIQGAPEGLVMQGLQRVVDGATPQALRSYLELQLEMVEIRSQKEKAVFETLGAYSPAFGMIGTIVGLIKMLLTMKDPGSLGAAMGLALVTTFYGAVLANLIFLPIAGKLQVRLEEELLLGEMAITGLVAICAGENPSIVEETLSLFLAGVTAVEDKATKEAVHQGTEEEAEARAGVT